MVYNLLDDEKIRHDYPQYRNIFYLNCLFDICIIYLNNKIAYDVFPRRRHPKMPIVYIFTEQQKQFLKVKNRRRQIMIMEISNVEYPRKCRIKGILDICFSEDCIFHLKEKVHLWHRIRAEIKAETE